MHVSGCRIEQVDATHDLGNAVLVVVYDDGQVVRDEAVAAPDDEIAGFRFQPLPLRSLQPVGKCDAGFVRAHAYRGLLRRTSGAACARIDDPEGAAGRVGQVTAGAAAGIGMTGVAQAATRNAGNTARTVFLIRVFTAQSLLGAGPSLVCAVASTESFWPSAPWISPSPTISISGAMGMR